MPVRGGKSHIRTFFIAYAVVLGALGVFGYYAMSEGLMTPAKPVASHGFKTDLAYYDLPRMTVAVGGSGGAPHVRLDIALEVATKDVDIIDGFQPRITDRLNAFLSSLPADQITHPVSPQWLRDQLLKQVNSAGSPAPVHDLMFRQFIIM